MKAGKTIVAIFRKCATDCVPFISYRDQVNRKSLLVIFTNAVPREKLTGFVLRSLMSAKHSYLGGLCMRTRNSSFVPIILLLIDPRLKMIKLRALVGAIGVDLNTPTFNLSLQKCEGKVSVSGKEQPTCEQSICEYPKFAHDFMWLPVKEFSSVTHLLSSSSFVCCSHSLFMCHHQSFCTLKSRITHLNDRKIQRTFIVIVLFVSVRWQSVNQLCCRRQPTSCLLVTRYPTYL